MSHTFRSALRRKLLAAVAPALLLATTSASAPIPAADADTQWYTEAFYSDATYSVRVGKGLAYCDGDYFMISGYQTAYSTVRYIAECP